MQEMNVVVTGGIDINVNFTFHPRQAEHAAPAATSDDSDAWLEEAAQQLEKLPKTDKQEDLPMSDGEDEDEDEDVRYEEHGGIPHNGVLFHPCDIVMVVHPECGASAMTVEDSRSVLDVFEGDEVGCLFPLLDLMMTFKPDAVVAVDGRKYLIGPAVVFSTVGQVTTSLDGDDIYLVKRILEEQCEAIVVGNQLFKALPL